MTLRGSFKIVGDTMRNLILVLVAFIAVVTFIRAYDGPQADLGNSPRGAAIESPVDDD